jgi:hypothetical protein
MRKIVLGLALLAAVSVKAQKKNPEELLNAAEALRIESILAADAMEGRQAFSKGIEKAAAFIADEFTKTGLKTWNNSGSYLQSFSMIRAKSISQSAEVEGVQMSASDVVVITCQPELSITEHSGYEQVSIAPGVNFLAEARKYATAGRNLVVQVDTSYRRSFNNLMRMKAGAQFKTDKSVVFILANRQPSKFSIRATNEITEQKLANVVGVLPGKSMKDQYVIFSGHYDHLGIRQTKDKDGNVLPDSIYNGANDDAAGTTAVIMLAKYYKALNNNARTLIFVAFTAEEVGGYGAQYFSRQFDPEAVKAMFNIEMIGTESKWGKNSAYITGYERTDMGKMLQANLEGSGFNFYPDPYPSQQLFFRSDNATLARLGVPAHTISTSKMENPPEPNYHKVSDEVSTLDMDNMAMIIKSIAISAKGIVAGKQTPSRVDVSDLNRPAAPRN